MGKVLGQKVSVIGDTETEITPTQVLVKKYVSTGGSIITSNGDTTCVAFYEIHGRKLTVSVGNTVNSACRTLTYATSLDQTSGLVQADTKVGDGQSYSKVIDSPSSTYKYLCICYSNVAENEVIEQYPVIDSLSLNNKLDNIDDFSDALEDSIIKSTELTSGKYYSLGQQSVGDTLNDPLDNASWGCTLVSVKKGDKVTIYTYGGTNGRAYGITDSSKKILSMAASSANYTSSPAVLTIEQDGYVVINNNAGNSIFSYRVEHHVMDLIDDARARIGDLEGDVTALQADYKFPKYQNNPFPVYKDTIKILAIGNSYTDDPTAYLPELVTASGIDTTKFCVYKCVTAASSLEDWAGWYSDNTTKWIQKVCGDITVTIGYGSTGGTLSAILAKDWDVIILQQFSQKAPNYATFNPYLTQLVTAIRSHCSNQKVCIGFQLVWRYKEGYTALTPQGEARWKAQVEAIKHMAVEDGVDFIIPTGTAIENARNTTTFGSVDGELTRDGTHLGYGVGRYIAACTWYQMLLAPIFGVPIIGNSATHEIGSGETGTTYEGIAVTNSNKLLCQQCAMSATIDMFGVSAV